jgi:hypothetical protein
MSVPLVVELPAFLLEETLLAGFGVGVWEGGKRGGES